MALPPQALDAIVTVNLNGGSVIAKDDSALSVTSPWIPPIENMVLEGCSDDVPDGGFHAWLFIISSFIVEGTIWGFAFRYDLNIPYILDALNLMPILIAMACSKTTCPPIRHSIAHPKVPFLPSLLHPQTDPLLYGQPK